MDPSSKIRRFQMADRFYRKTRHFIVTPHIKLLDIKNLVLKKDLGIPGREELVLLTFCAISQRNP